MGENSVKLLKIVFMAGKKSTMKTKKKAGRTRNNPNIFRRAISFIMSSLKKISFIDFQIVVLMREEPASSSRCRRKSFI